MFKAVVVIVEVVANVPTLIKEPLLFDGADSAVDIILDNYYNSREWEYINRSVNKDKNKLIFGFKNKDNELEKNIIYIKIFNKEESDRLDEIKTMIDLINTEDYE